LWATIALIKQPSMYLRLPGKKKPSIAAAEGALEVMSGKWPYYDPLETAKLHGRAAQRLLTLSRRARCIAAAAGRNRDRDAAAIIAHFLVPLSFALWLLCEEGAFP
jgi:hypothetical protein